MNSYDLEAVRAIRHYYERHGKAPIQIEATAAFRSSMTQDYFTLNDTQPALACIPVMPLGAGGIVYRRLTVINEDINMEKAECATAEEFQRVGAKLARAGLLIMEPKKTTGQQIYPPFLLFSQIEAWIFGEESVLEEVAKETSNHLSEER